MLFEISWEVCNKVGGIYTVLKSKAGHIKNAFKENYFLVGPYFPDAQQIEFDEKAPPASLKDIFDTLRDEGIICHFGRWLISSSPNVILVDYSSYKDKANGIKARFYEVYGIDSLGTNFFDYDEPIVWGVAVARLLETYKSKHPSVKIIAHCHEWLAAGTALKIKDHGPNIKVVFTTHATVLGRTLAASDPDFYNKLDQIKPESEARRLGVHTKHQTEAAVARSADIFTTVSDITAIEAKYFLGREPEMVLPNGLDLGSFPTFDDLSIKHKFVKNKIMEFLLYTLFPYYSFNLAHTMLFFTAARYEFHGKGLDVFIRALGKLDKALVKEGKRKTVVAFFWIPTNVRGINPEILENKTFFEDIKESVDAEIPEIRERLLLHTLAGRAINKEDIFSEEALDEIQKKLKRFKKGGQPLLCTHLIDEAHDPIINAFKANNLLNHKDNAVKVFLYPTYLSGADGALDLTYYECIQGCQFGIFPSFYEPWGYTPVEAAALGTCTVTTDLSGFGKYAMNHMFKEQSQKGIYVLPRFGVSDDEFVDKLCDVMLKFVSFTRPERIENKMAAKQMSVQFDWDHLVENYFKAYEMVLKNE